VKPLTTAIIGALVVAVAVFGYLYYQRTRNDITIQMPKVELKRRFSLVLALTIFALRNTSVFLAVSDA
jgi:hypothetical protein